MKSIHKTLTVLACLVLLTACDDAKNGPDAINADSLTLGRGIDSSVPVPAVADPAVADPAASEPVDDPQIHVINPIANPGHIGVAVGHAGMNPGIALEGLPVVDLPTQNVPEIFALADATVASFNDETSLLLQLGRYDAATVETINGTAARASVSFRVRGFELVQDAEERMNCAAVPDDCL